MQITIKGRHLTIDDRMRSSVERRLDSAVRKYFSSAIEAQVVFEKVAHLIRSDLTIHIGQGMNLQSHAEKADAIASFNVAADRLEKRMRRYKRRLRDHHKDAREVRALEDQQRRSGEAVLSGAQPGD